MKLRNRAISFLVTTAMVWNSAVMPVTVDYRRASLFGGLTDLEMQALASKLAEVPDNQSGGEERDVDPSSIQVTPADSQATEAEASAQGASADVQKPGSELADDNPSSSTVDAGKRDSEKDTASDDPAVKTVLEQVLESADGHTYLVRVTADASAGVPSDARLEVREVLQTPKDMDAPENADRPRATETFVSKGELDGRLSLVRRGMQIRSGEDWDYFNKLLELSVTTGDGEVVPQAPLTVTVETDAVDVADSAAIEAGWFDPAPAGYDEEQVLDNTVRPLSVQNKTEDKAREEQDAALPVKVSFQANALGRFALLGVARAKSVLEEQGEQLVVQGAGSQTVRTEDVESPELPAGVEPRAAFAVLVDDAPAYGAHLWAHTAAVAGAQERPAGTGYVAWRLVDGKLGDQLFGAEGTKKPVALEPGDVVVLGWDTGLRNTSLNLGGVTLDGMLPERADGTATNAELDAAQLTGDDALKTIASYDVRVTTDEGDWQPQANAAVDVTIANKAIDAEGDYEVLRVGEDGKAQAMEGVKLDKGTASFSADELGTYVVAERVTLGQTIEASDGKTYEVEVTYGPEAKLPKDAKLSVRELKDAERADYEQKAREALGGGELEYMRAFDITIQDKDGNELEPQAEVETSIRLADKNATAEASVLHFADDKGEAQVLETQTSEGVAVGGQDAVSYDFKTGSFSVYAVAYTVDFHYGEGDFDFSILGGNTISFKELAARLHLVTVADQPALDAILASLHPEPSEEVRILDDEFESETDTSESDLASAKPVAWPEEIERFVAQIDSVEWSNPAVARVTRVERQTSVGDLVDSLGLVNQFSADMSDAQIEGEMNVVLAEGDWAFISTQPFSTEEKLTITMKNGDVYEIGVTDAQGYSNVTLRNPTVSIKTGDTVTSHASNLNFALTTNGLARVTGKNVNTAGTEYYIPNQITYNGKQYLVYDVGALTPAAINGRTVFFDDDLCLRMLDADQTQLADIVDHILAKMMVDGGLASESDFDGQDGRPSPYVADQELTDQQVDALAAKNGYAVGVRNEVSGNLYELFKRAQYDAEANKVTIELKYFQKMKKNVPLDFIFVYDDSGTMSSVAYNHTEQKNADNGNIRYAATQSVWCRIALQVILKGIMDQQAKGYDIRMAPIAFASNAFWDKDLSFYETYVKAKQAIGTIYTSGGTEHYKALDAATLYARKSVSEQRNPIVVYLSDFHSNANTTRAKQSAAALRAVYNSNSGEYVQVYTIHMFEPNYRYDRNIATDSHHMDILNDTQPVSDLLMIFDTITKDAIGYYIGKNTSVQDALSPGLVASAESISLTVPSAQGSSVKDGDTAVWTFSNGGVRLQAGKMYSETITVQLKDGAVFSPEMPSNSFARVVKTSEDENGGLHPTTVNEISENPKPKTSLVMVLGRLDKSGNQTSDIIAGARFTLSGGGNAAIELTTDDAGRLVVPSGFHLTQGSYTLTQLSTDELEDETPAMVMPANPTWTLTVNADDTMSVSGGDPAMTVRKGQLRIWNKQHVEIMPTLIPVTVRKTWVNGPVGGETVPFTIYGVYNGDSHVLTAFDGAKQTDATSVFALTADNVTVGTDAGGHTTWTKRVFVPDRAGSAVFYTEDSNGNNQTYSYVVKEGEAPSAAGGYYSKGNEAVVVNTAPIYETIYKTTGGWEVYSGSTTQAQIHINLNGSRYYGTNIQGGDVASNNAYNLVYKNTSRVYVEYTYYPTNNRSDDVKAIAVFNTTNDGDDHSSPGAQFMYVNLPSAWAAVAESAGHRYANTFEITKLIFYKSDGSSLTVYDKENNVSTNANYLAKAPKTTFDSSGRYQGTYTGYLLVFDKKGDNTLLHTHIGTNPTQTIKRLTPETTTPIENKAFNNSLTLTMENTYVPLRTLDVTSTWRDGSIDKDSTGEIQSVMYEVLKKDGDNWVPATTREGETLSTAELTDADVEEKTDGTGNPYYETKLNLTLPEGTYKVRQASYTLSNGAVVSADDSGAFTAYQLTSPLSPNPTIDNANHVDTYAWDNARKTFDTTVNTVWIPGLQDDEDPTDGVGLSYVLSYRSYTGGAVSEHQEPGANRKSEGWTATHSAIPAYGVDGEETGLSLNPNTALADKLANWYVTDVTSAVDGNGHKTFTITNTERHVNFTVRKDWLDAEGQMLPEEEQKPVRIEIWGVEKPVGVTLFENGLPKDASFTWPTWDGTGDQNDKTRVNETKGFFKQGESYYVVRQTVDVPNVQLNYGPEGNYVQEQVVKFNGHIRTITSDEQVSGQLTGLTRGEVLHDTRNGRDDYYVFCRNDAGTTQELFPHADWYKILLDTSGGGNGSVADIDLPHETQSDVNNLIAEKHAVPFDKDTKRAVSPSAVPSYEISADTDWVFGASLPARYYYFAREVEVDGNRLDQGDYLSRFEPHYDYDQGAVTVAISNRSPIARVRQNNGAWRYFDTLLTVHAENYPEHQGAFDYANTLSGNVEIELLRETHPRYTLAHGFTFSANNNVTVRTSQDPQWNPTGAGHFVSTLYRGFNGDALLKLMNKNASLSLEDIILDGDKDGTVTGSAKSGGVYGLIQVGDNAGTGAQVGGGTLKVLGGTTLRNSKAADYGGAIAALVADAHVVVRGTANNKVNITNCEATAFSGGGVYIDNGADLEMDHAVIEGCQSRPTETNEYGGAGVAIADGNSTPIASPGARITNTTITKCSTTGIGGGIFVSNSNAVIQGVTLGVEGSNADKNAATFGGGIAVTFTSNVSVSDTNVHNCTATSYGGGLYTYDNANVMLATTTVKNCSAQNGGAAIVGNGANVTLASGAFTANSATAKGAAVYVGYPIGDPATATFNMSGGSITGNVVDGDTGAVEAASNAARLYFSGSSRVYDNAYAYTENNESKSQQKNVVLNHDTNAIINMANSGLAGNAKIGVFVTGDEYTTDGEGNSVLADSIFNRRGIGGTDFGLFDNSANDAALETLVNFSNDRNGLTATSYRNENASDNKIYWGENAAYIKIINMSSVTTLYYKIIVDGGKYGNNEMEERLYKRGSKQQDPTNRRGSRDNWYFPYKLSSSIEADGSIKGASETIYIPNGVGKSCVVEVYKDEGYTDRVTTLTSDNLREGHGSQDFEDWSTGVTLVAGPRYKIPNGGTISNPDYKYSPGNLAANGSSTYYSSMKGCIGSSYNQAVLNNSYLLFSLIDIPVAVKLEEADAVGLPQAQFSVYTNAALTTPYMVDGEPVVITSASDDTVGRLVLLPGKLTMDDPEDFYLKETKTPDRTIDGRKIPYVTDPAQIYRLHIDKNNLYAKNSNEVELSTTYGVAKLYVQDATGTTYADGLKWKDVDKYKYKQSVSAWGRSSNNEGAFGIFNRRAICKIVRGTEEHAFARLKDALLWARTNMRKGGDGADKNDVTATIQMLVDYEIPASDKVALGSSTIQVDGESVTVFDRDICFTTAKTEDKKESWESYYFTPTFSATQGRVTTGNNPDSGEVAILRRAATFTDDSLFVVGNSSAGLSFEAITLDGAKANVATNGGLVKASAGTLRVGQGTTMRNSYVVRNALTSTDDDPNYLSSGNGGAIYAKGSGNPVVFFDGVTTGQKNIVIADCRARNRGAGVHVDSNSTLTVRGAIFRNCKANPDSTAENDGGGEVNAGGLRANVRVLNAEYSEFIGCEAIGGNGGGVYCYESEASANGETKTSATFTNCVVDGCKADAGGGIRSAMTDTTLTNTTIQNCEAVAGNGGGFNNKASSNSGAGAPESVRIAGCTIRNNSATAVSGSNVYGAGVRVSAARFTVTTANVNGEDKATVIEGNKTKAKGSNSKAQGGGIYFEGSEGVVEEAVISNNSATTNGGGVYQEKGAMTLRGTTISDCHAVSGGAGYVAGTSTMALEDTASARTTVVRNYTDASNFGAGFYVFPTAVLKLKDAPDFGESIYVDTDGNRHLVSFERTDNRFARVYYVYARNEDGTIAGAQKVNADTTDNGDVIWYQIGDDGNYYQATVSGGTVTRLSEDPVAAPSIGNFRMDHLDLGAFNGGQVYHFERQDIYIADKYEDPTSLVVNGKLTSDSGSIWVRCANVGQTPDHYSMLKPFAAWDESLMTTVDGEQVVNLSDADAEATMKVFRNACNDNLTGCGGDYLTGQKSEKPSLIYWTGGFDVVFMKADSYGRGLSGAEFSLYTDEECRNPYMMLFSGSTPATEDGKRGTTVSSDGTKTYKDKTGATVTLEKGEVLLSKVAPRTYYMKETAAPTENPDGQEYAYALDETLYKVDISGTGGLEIHKKSSDDATSYDVEVYKAKTREVTQGNDTVDVIQYIIQNEPVARHNVILRKVNAAHAVLAGARFRLFKADLTEITMGQPIYREGEVLPAGKAVGDSKGYYESDDFGIYFVGVLPEGRYYLLETGAPTGAAYAENLGKVFVLTIGESGDSVPDEANYQAPEAERGTEEDLIAAFQEWAKEQTPE